MTKQVGWKCGCKPHIRATNGQKTRQTCIAYRKWSWSGHGFHSRFAGVGRTHQTSDLSSTVHEVRLAEEGRRIPQMWNKAEKENICSSRQQPYRLPRRRGLLSCPFCQHVGILIAFPFWTGILLLTLQMYLSCLPSCWLPKRFGRHCSLSWHPALFEHCHWHRLSRPRRQSRDENTSPRWLLLSLLPHVAIRLLPAQGTATSLWQRGSAWTRLLRDVSSSKSSLDQPQTSVASLVRR